VIERIFGVLKRHFRILLLAPEYNVDIQSRIPAALCALHNFIRTHDPDDETEMQEIGMDEDVPVVLESPVTRPEKDRDRTGPLTG
jgi:hypothetical protein